MKQPAGILNRSAWGLTLVKIFSIRLVIMVEVLDAWRLELDAWSSAVPAGELEACRLKLGAWRLQLGASYARP